MQKPMFSKRLGNGELRVCLHPARLQLTDGMTSLVPTKFSKTAKKDPVVTHKSLTKKASQFPYL